MTAPATTGSSTASHVGAPAPAVRAAPAGPATGSSTIDPVKLLNKHKWTLLVASVIGAAMGVAAHFALLRVYPVWKPVAIFRCFPPQSDPTSSALFTNIEEMNKFMATQARQISQDVVLRRLAQSPELQDQAKKWCARFYMTGADGLPVFDEVKALKELRETVKARVVPTTYFIEVSMGYRDREDATTIVRLVSNTYLRVLTEEGGQISDSAVRAMREAIKRLDDDADAQRRRRDNIVKEYSIPGSIRDRSDAIVAQLQGVNEELLTRRANLQAASNQVDAFEQRLASPTGDRYTDDMVAESERDPQLAEANQRVNALETERQSLRNRGYNEEHRVCREIDNRLAAAKQIRDEVRGRVLDKIAQAEVETLKRSINGIQAQVKDLETQQSELTTRLTELYRLQMQLDDIDNQITQMTQTRGSKNSELQNLLAVSQLDTARRVVLVQQANLPTELSFPRITIMVPAGTFLLTLLVGGVALVRELIDQRVKSPADIGIIPRTRLLGWVPDAAEDPEGMGAAETAFRDRGRGVMAESFRQLRAGLAKRIQVAGHRSIVVMSGLPESGATTVASNLALSCAAADMRVLLIDANYRRPALHRVFGVPDAPGLADVLAKAATVEEAAQATGTANLDVLTAGTRDLRLLERLSTDAMTDLLAGTRGRYDLVLLDVAPAIVGGEGTALAQRCDASLLVVRAMSEKRGLVARVKNELMDTRGEFLGVVVNAVRAASGGYLKHNIRASQEYHREDSAAAAA